MYLILLGPPMSGKGTQAARLSRLLGVPQVSSGDLFRDNIKNQTELGRKAKAYIDRGDLVPDEITIGMVAQRLSQPDCAGGALLDGFPRTIPQAEELDQILSDLGASLTGVLSVGVPENVLVDRASGRRICRSCGKSYHLTFNPPEREGLCDVDEGELYQRKDDLPETVRQRLAVYQQQTSPLSKYYLDRGLLREVNGDQPIEDVAADIARVVNQL
ncbi:MAG TPA: adenylate kinase [Chloroflexi bacterium]|nr:MAG: adenylate kinase [Chloroflexota bacterium]HDD55793.1 adenylate kinase [Chloroflexota bacterium]